MLNLPKVLIFISYKVLELEGLLHMDYSEFVEIFVIIFTKKLPSGICIGIPQYGNLQKISSPD